MSRVCVLFSNSHPGANGHPVGTARGLVGDPRLDACAIQRRSQDVRPSGGKVLRDCNEGLVLYNIYGITAGRFGIDRADAPVDQE